MESDRTLKAVLMGVGLLVGAYFGLQLIRIVWVLAILFLPCLVIFAMIYLVGYGAPNLGDWGRKFHKWSEAKARKGLDWLDFAAPPWMWPAIRAARTFLDWLGLQVA